MEELFSSDTQDAATPLNSAGTPTQSYRNAAGDFDLKNKYGTRKVKSRRDLDQPKDGEEPMRDGTAAEYIEGPLGTGGSQTDDATQRYFGSFSLEAKRHVWDLLKQHPKFGDGKGLRLNRVGNNTREVLPNDPTITQENGGYRITQQQPQASQPKYL
jgi:hypothetical protein